MRNGMNRNRAVRAVLICVSLFGMAVHSLAGTIYVATNSASDGPGTNWVSAFRSIQQGVDAAVSGDTVLVSNGVYATGGRVLAGRGVTNRVMVTNQVTVKSVSGPIYTIISGSRLVGGAPVRGACIGEGGGYRRIYHTGWFCRI